MLRPFVHPAKAPLILFVAATLAVCQACLAQSSKPAGEQTPEQVEAAIKQAGATYPDWWDGVKLDYPKTLDLTWTKSEGIFDSLSLDEYLAKEIRPKPANWKLGIKVVSEAIRVNKNSPERLRQTYEALGDMFVGMMGDFDHAAHYYRLCGTQKVYDRLALCYWKLGNKTMASDLLNSLSTDPTPTGGVIRMWGYLQEPQKATELAEASAKDGNKETLYLAAGDALRTCGQGDKAIEYYQKAMNLDTKDARTKPAAQLNINALKALAKLEMSHLRDGKYTETVQGYSGDLTMELAIRSGKIASAKVTDHKEDGALLSTTEIPARIVKAQGFRGIDAVSGATTSSSAILDAAIMALSDPPIDPNIKYKDGEYVGSGQGHKSTIEVKVTIKGGKIVTIEVTKQRDDKAWWDRAVAVIPQIIRNQGVEGVKPVTRATRSSNGIFRATNDALTKAQK